MEGGKMTSQNSMLPEVVLLPPRVDREAPIARSNGSIVVAKHKVLVLESSDHSTTCGVGGLVFPERSAQTFGRESNCDSRDDSNPFLAEKSMREGIT
jgi:hypothetical protein